MDAPDYSGKNALQPWMDAGALSLAQSLKPASAWPLAAADVECGFCEWLG